ncbi:S-methyl-5-thioribose-1-phosphate isomerase [bacterium]|nr:S-methyl-5-thioribose-1-phosphate isomerase [bacterium]
MAWDDGRVVVLEQTLLPERVEFLSCADVPALCDAIVRLAVRGAPAIGIAAAYGLALAAHRAAAAQPTAGAALAAVREAQTRLAATRPTAVNLFWALDRCADRAQALAAAGAGPTDLAAGLLDEARRIHAEDLDMSRRLGAAGAALLPDCATVLTHCNAGGLATGGYGTALGVVYAAQEAGKAVRVFADETRPLLQGARLTAWELAQRGIEVTLLCEGAAGALLRGGVIDAVITGADRIAANGDTANKIGTYPLAVLADRHGVPFYVAAPRSTFDPDAPDGAGIAIEQRGADEVLRCAGHRTAPAGVGAWNPAFDVTPGELITAFITERGILRPPFDAALAGCGRP